jgi:hypothetical protein
MKKLRLDLAALRVESFLADAQEDGRGTVHAHYSDTDTDTFPDTAGSCFSNYCFPTDWCGTTNMCASANASCAGMCGNEN